MGLVLAAFAILMADVRGDYPDGASVEMRQAEPRGEPQPAGLWPALGEIWQVGLALAVIGIGIALLLDPTSPPTRVPRPRPGTGWTRVFFVLGATGLAIAVLDGFVAGAETRASTAPGPTARRTPSRAPAGPPDGRTWSPSTGPSRIAPNRPLVSDAASGCFRDKITRSARRRVF